MLVQLELVFKTIFELIFLFLNPMFSVPILIAICIYYYKLKKYKEESYYKITNVTYFNVRYNTGRYGEYLTYKHLKDFENQGAKFLFNIYIPKTNDETTEIDVLMISPKGLFVFESKNYSGWIFGSDNQKYWYQTLPSGRYDSHKEKFYNPVFQNNTHIKYLKSMIGEQIPIHSIITFSDRCTLKNVKIKYSNVYVINRYQVYKLVSSIYNNNLENYLSDMQIDEIYNSLYPFTQVDDNIKQKHIDNIYNNIIEDISINKKEFNNKELISIEEKVENKRIVEIANNSIVDIEDNSDEINKFFICPCCGSKLILRTAKYGVHAGKNFYGCSNYPKCKYKKQIQVEKDIN